MSGCSLTAVLEIFQHVDKNGDGLIAVADLIAVLDRLGHSDAQTAVSAADLDRHGQIQYEDFVRWAYDQIDDDEEFAQCVNVFESLPDLASLSLSREVSIASHPPALSADELVGAEKAEAASLLVEPREPSGDAGDPRRQSFCERLHGTPFLESDHVLFMHGRGYDGLVKKPRATWTSEKAPRDDHDCPEWLRATEYEDSQEVAECKVKKLAELMRLSRKTVLYTGAGISAAVVGQAARSGTNTVGWKGSPLQAQPTKTHFALGFLGRQGLVHGWVQQNHDGLPQKAGFPQERINEIHGSWFDPGNPVVKYSGSLHPRAYPWMVQEADTADLVLVLGTSLGGLNADQVASNAAARSLLGAALGTVCINLQQTAVDGMMTLRIFGQSDHVLMALVREMGFPPLSAKLLRWPAESVVLVPYDRDGRKVAEGSEQHMWLDLSDRAKVRLTPGHNVQGAKQPQFMHIGAARPVTFKGQKRAPAPGNGTVVRREQYCFVLNIEGQGMHLGVWWLVAAVAGAVDVLPLVNVNPRFAKPK